MLKREVGVGQGREEGGGPGAWASREGEQGGAEEGPRERGRARGQGTRTGVIYFTIKSGVQTSAEQNSEIPREPLPTLEEEGRA